MHQSLDFAIRGLLHILSISTSHLWSDVTNGTSLSVIQTTIFPSLEQFQRCSMTPDEREQMAILFERIAKEKNHDKFAKFVEQLNALLNKKAQRLENKAMSIKSS